MGLPSGLPAGKHTLHQIQINASQTMDEIYKPEVLKGKMQMEIKPKWVMTYIVLEEVIGSVL